MPGIKQKCILICLKLLVKGAELDIFNCIRKQYYNNNKNYQALAILISLLISLLTPIEGTQGI